MSERLEHTLMQLLVPDSNVIKQATHDLKVLVNDPSFVPNACQLLGSSPHSQVRQYAALLLRRKFLKRKDWNSAPSEVCQSIRDNLLQVLLNEPEKSVRKSLAQLIATVAKHDLPDNRWPALFQFLQKYVLSENAEQREVGSFLLSTVASVAHGQLKPHMTSLLTLCSKMLNETENHHVAFHTIQTLTNVVPSIDSDTQKFYESLMPKVIEVLRNLSKADQEMAADAMDILDELVECEVSILQPHIRLVVHFSLELSKDTQMSSTLRVKALSFISSITRMKKKSIAKLNLMEPILAVLFPIICDAKSDDEEEEETDAESTSPSACACQTIDIMALHLPAEKFIPLLMKHVQPALVSTESNLRRAAFISIAVSAEGCADHMRTKLLQSLLQQVYQGMADPVGDVRNAAMFALGQFSEHLQPDISKYSSELLPILFDCVSKLSVEPGQRSRDVIRVYYAMESFCENLGKDILPYVPQLMEFLIGAVDHAPKLEAKALAISAIAATANAAGDSFLPYFQRTIESLRHFLVATENEEQVKVQVQAIETLGVLARQLGENFRPLAAECLNFGFTLINDSTEPDLKRTVYGLFGALSTLLKEELGPHLELIVKQLLATIESTEGITAHYDDQDAQVLQIFSQETENGGLEVEDGDEDSDDEDSAVQGITVTNSFIDEKQDALATLGELSYNTGLVFVPYMEDSFKRVTEMLFYPTADIRRAAAVASSQLCRAVWRIPTVRLKVLQVMLIVFTVWLKVLSNKQSIMSSTLNKADEVVRTAMLTTSMGKMIEMVKLDDDRQVATTVLDSIKEMLDEIKEPVLTCIERPDILIAIIKDVFQRKIASQDNDDEVDDDEAEFDSILIESAGELIPSLAKVIGGQKFAPYFAGLLPELLKKLKTTSKVPEKSFAVGTIAETLQALGDSSSHFVGPLYPVATSLICEEDEEVRSNSIFCLGVLASNGGAQVLSRYPDVLKMLFDTLSKETNGRCMDNICAAVCRMIIAHAESVNIAQIFPVVMQCLPLKEDHDENITVYRCVTGLYAARHPEVKPHIPVLLVMVGDLLAANTSSAELKQLLTDFARDVSVNFPDVMSAAVTLAGPETLHGLQGCLQ